MKKLICLVLALTMLAALAACGAKQETADWTRAGYFADENGNLLTITWMEDVDEPGWYVGLMWAEAAVEDSYGGTLEQKGADLQGTLATLGEKDDLTVTVSEEGKDGVVLKVDGGDTYHFKKQEMEEASIIVHANTEGSGNIAYTEGEATPEIDPDAHFQSHQINLAEAKKHTFLAYPDAGSRFVKWTRNGEDFSTEAQITVLLDESADFVAVFEEDPDWQNPVMNFVGEYQCDRANATVECLSADEAIIVIEWGSSATELTRWTLSGPLDTEKLTIRYSGCSKDNVVYDDSGEVKSEEQEYGDGTGTITFHEDGTFTWHEDQSDSGKDLVFEFVAPAQYTE